VLLLIRECWITLMDGYRHSRRDDTHKNRRTHREKAASHKPRDYRWLKRAFTTETSVE
jgi:hypothetical protein